MNDKIKFISTKLKTPSPRKNFVRRIGLYNRLQNIDDYKVVLVKGVAGSGKTTLLSSFIREYPIIPFKWLTVDSDNNNVFSFWYYFVETVTDYLGDMKNEISILFDAVLQKEDIERLIEILINQLDRDEQLGIVIDDFHCLDDKTLVNSFAYFIKHMPGNVHIVILTRDEPDIYMGDLIMSGALLLIDEQQLKFSRQEGISFLTDSLELGLHRDLMDEINELCEGWVGGLQLIALACINKSPKVMKDIRINNKYTIEYLSKEILDSLSEKHRNFLVRTCILSYFDEDICNKLLGINSSGTIITELVQKDLFMVCIDEDRGLYRYHNVFGEFLKLRFSTLDEAEKSAFIQKAANIFRTLGDLEESARLLQLNMDYKGMLEILDLLEPNYKSWSYLAQIPMEFMKHNLDFIVQLFFYYYYNSNFKGIETIIERCNKEMEDRDILKFLKIVKAMLVDFELCTELLTVDEIEQMEVKDATKSILFLKTAAFLYLQYEMKAALLFIEKAIAYDYKNNPFVELSILSLKCGVKEEQGDLAQCERLYLEIFKRLENLKILSNFRTNYYIGLTGVYIKTYQIEKADECMKAARSLFEEDNMYMDAAYLYNIVEVRLLQGEAEEARRLLQKLMLHEAYQNNLIFMSGVIKLFLYAGSMYPDLAKKYKKLYEQCDGRYIRIEDRLAYAKILFNEGNEEEALQLADEILPALRSQKIKFKLVEAILFKVKMLQGKLQEEAEVRNMIREAVYYSCENRIISPFIYEGRYMVKYLTAVREEREKDLKSGEKAFINELVEFLKKYEKEESILSRREVEVLKEMATGATNKEIADKLCISLATVKTHIINIYSKLQVGSRVEAVDIAKQKKLID